MTGRERALVAGLVLALALLAWHVRTYFHLNDDAFISFRYARNFAEGHGLVFNPGYEWVEGYTNFLWVLVLAALHFVSVPLQVGAPALSIAATVALWALVVRHAWSHSRPRGLAWLALMPPLWLATNRSFAVWATSGLETRLFELLVVAAVLRLVTEVRAALGESRTARPLAGILFGAAALTRPDGMLMGAGALGVAALFLARRGKLQAAAFWSGAGSFAVIVAAHFFYRRVYYGAWLPNTYYAKVGASRWDLGLAYHAAFLLEYAAWLWIPGIVAAVRWHWRRGSAYFPAIVAAVLIPHALYVAKIGGDHFEYRPQDLAFPFAFLLLGQGTAELFRSRGRSMGAGLYAAAILAAGWFLPWQSHQQAPDRYLNGFPGRSASAAEAVGFLAPDRSWLTRLPGLREVAEAHRALVFETTAHLVGVRQEEHRQFLEKVLPEARRLAGLVADGTLPRDTHLATSCIGAIGWYSDLRIFDRHGLTDAGVARSERTDPRGLIAHEKRATIQDGRERGIDFWAFDPVHSLWKRDDPAFQTLVRIANDRGIPAYAADVGDGWSLLGILPFGPERAAARFPRLEFRPTAPPDAEREPAPDLRPGG